jgi:hypothetical protein
MAQQQCKILNGHSWIRPINAHGTGGHGSAVLAVQGKDHIVVYLNYIVVLYRNSYSINPTSFWCEYLSIFLDAVIKSKIRYVFNARWLGFCIKESC